MTFNYNFFLPFFIFLDAPEAWQLTCQDPSSPAHEGMITFHEYLIFFLIQIGIVVCWYLLSLSKQERASRFTHESFLEIFWTVLPAIILLFIAVPSFILLYSLDDVLNPNITVKVVAHQWYWSYEYSDYFTSTEDAVYLADVAFDSYLVSTADLVEGAFRLLEVDNRLVLPINTHIRLLICSGDVLHSWAVPATGVKLDACPGRVSETNLFLKRSGVYFGQCSEICGANHGLMPIVIQAVPAKVFFNWIASKALDVNTTSTHTAETLWFDVSLLEKAATLISVATFFNWESFRATKNKVWAFAASHIEQYGTPGNLNYLWSFGAMAGLVLVIMMLSGSFLAMHYVADTRYAFATVIEITENVKYGWLMRYIHANGASVFFIILYLHILKALFFGSYAGTRWGIWYAGLVIFILIMATAFIGYVLPWGQMSLWGATVITNLFSSMPFVGGDLVNWLWGGFAIDRPTLMKFFTLHFTLPYLTMGMVFVHLGALHAIGSNNPMGSDKVPVLSFAPNFVIKDILVFFVTLVFLGTLWSLFPNDLGHPDNSMIANCMVTPPHIVPEWYFLPFYAILRSIPDKDGGIVAMAAAIGALFTLPFINSSDLRSAFYRPIFLVCLTLWVLDVIFLGWVGQLPVESPYVQFGFHATLFYFSFFVFLVPFSGEIEKKFAL